MSDFILLIMNCEKYRYKADIQKNTWLKDVNIPYFHVIGNEELETPYKFEDKILYVRTPDDYISLPKKVISAYNAIESEFNYKYIFKTDDDQQLTCPTFFEQLINELIINQSIHYGGIFIKIENEHFSDYYEVHPELPKNILIKNISYCVGRFYLLSKCAVQSLLIKKKYIEGEYFEDYAIGYYLDPIFKENIIKLRYEPFVDMENNDVTY